MPLDALHVLPFASAAAWTLAAFAPFPRGRPRTPPEAAFLAFALSLGVWALLDGFLLQAADPGLAVALARARDAVASAGGLALLYFAKWSTRGRAAADLLLVAPVVGAVAVGWLGVAGVVLEPWGPRIVRVLPPYAAWFLQSLAYVAAAMAFLLLGLRALWREDRALGLRAASVLVVGGVATALALATNIAIALGGSTAPPPFSSLLVAPGLALLASARVAPLPRGRVVRSLRRMLRSFDRQVLGAALLAEDGTVFGIAMQRPEDRQQFDLPEVMVMIQQFSAGSPRGAPAAQAVSVGGVTFLVRRRASMALILAVRGRGHDFLEAAVEETFARFEEVPGLLAAAREGDIPAMGRIHGVLRELVAASA